MEQRGLGQSGLRVSSVVLGAMAAGASGDDDDERRAAVIEAACEAGVTAIDTAPLYGFGRSERVVGRALGRLRERPLVLTKVGLRWDDPSGHGEPLFTTRDAGGKPLVVRRDSRPESILLELERSLDRLGGAALDLVQVHQRDPLVPLDETMGALRDAVHAGTVRAVGVSNFTPKDVLAARAALRDVPLASVQSQLSLLVRDEETRALATSRRIGSGFLAYSPLAQGLLTGAYGPRRLLSASDWRRDLPLFSVRSRAAIERALAEVVAPMAARHGASLSQLALAWVLTLPGASAVIAGASSPEQARENARAARIPLALSERAELGTAFAKLRVDRSLPLRTRMVRRARAFFPRELVASDA